ncbi:unnamed protein product [marine sediment metagenome]
MVFREKVAKTGTIADVTNQLATFMDTQFWAAFWQNFASNELTYLRTVAQMIFPTREAPFVEDVSAGQAGAVVKPAMNGTTALLISEYGEDWTPNFRGRMYLPGLDEDSASLGRVKAGALTSMQLAWDINMMPDVVLPGPADVTLKIGVFSPTLAKVPTLPVSSDLQIAIVRPRIATQRRRRTPVAVASP